MSLPHLLTILIMGLLSTNPIQAFELAPNGSFPITKALLPEAPIQAPLGSKSLCFDNHGNFWALSPSLRKGHWQIMVLPAQDQSKWVVDKLGGLGSGPYEELICDHKDHIWLRSKKELYRLYAHSPSWQLMSADSTFPQGQITAMCTAPTGEVVVALAGGNIVTIDRKAPAPRQQIRNIIKVESAPKHISEMGVDAEGQLWARTKKNKSYTRSGSSTAWQKNWELVSLMPGGSHDLGGDILNGKFYMAWAISGDFGYPSTGKFHDQMLSFDHQTKLWKKEVTYGMPRGYCGTGVLGDQIWTVGGDALDPEGKRYTTDLAQIYDTKTKKISQGPKLPALLPSTLCLSSGERLYVLGYTKGKNQALKLYSIGQGETKWTAEPDGPIGGGSSYGCELDGKLYTVVDHRYLAVYDTSLKTWSTHVPPHNPRSPAVGHHDGKIWLMGGRGKEGGKVSYTFNPMDASWNKGPDLPRELSWACAFNIEGELYLTGGASSSPYAFSHRTYKLR
jgi:hypothetical protein